MIKKLEPRNERSFGKLDHLLRKTFTAKDLISILEVTSSKGDEKSLILALTYRLNLFAIKDWLTIEIETKNGMPDLTSMYTFKVNEPMLEVCRGSKPGRMLGKIAGDALERAARRGTVYFN